MTGKPNVVHFAKAKRCPRDTERDLETEFDCLVGGGPGGGQTCQHSRFWRETPDFLPLFS
jgi:hypothetical protein